MGPLGLRTPDFAQSFSLLEATSGKPATSLEMLSLASRPELGNVFALPFP